MSFALSAESLAAEITVDGTTCTLANAVRSANTNSSVMGCTVGSGADTINLTVDVNIVTPENVPESVGMPDITSSITIRGNDHTIARTGAGTFRIFRVASNGELTLERLTVKDGGGDGYGGNGGGVLIFRNRYHRAHRNRSATDSDRPRD